MNEESLYQHDNVETGGANRRASWLENLSYFIILAVVFLLPIAFIPSVTAPFQLTKVALVLAGILAALFFYIVSRLEDGKVVFPYNKIVAAVWAVPLVYFVSSLLSDSIRLSLIGNGFDADTFGFMLGMALLLTLTSLLFRAKEKMFRVYMFLLFSFWILALFQIARLFFGTDLFSFGVFTTSASTLIGKWNDMAIFAGLAAILALSALEGLALSARSRGILYGTLVAALFLLAVINFIPAWIALGLFALGFFVYGISKRTLYNLKQGTLGGVVSAVDAPSAVSLPALLILAVSLAFILFGGSFGAYVDSAFNISHLEARPSWQSTINIGKQVYEENFLFGSGPNTFVQNWTLHKPQAINNSIFWTIDFSTGIGVIPTSFVTTGVFGILAWAVFFGALLYAGLRTLVFRPADEAFAFFFSLSSFLAAAYLWVMAFIYVPSVTLLAFAFFFTGMFVASLRFSGDTRTECEVTFAVNPRLGFVAVLALTVVLIAGAVGLYVVVQQYLSGYSFQRAAYAMNVSGDVDVAERNVSQSLQLYPTDRAFRLAADANLVRLNQLFNAQGLSPEEQRNQFQQLFTNVVQNARAAIDANPRNYQNWMTLGRTYASVVPLNIEGAYDNARVAYDRAIELHPNNAIAYLTLARLELARGGVEQAKEFIASAIERKNNYTAAIFLLAQIQIQEGNLNEAIASVEAATTLDPTNPATFFQLGLLRLNAGDDAGAISAFERAVTLNEAYANARYFLGLSYHRAGDTERAIAQFERVAELNPDNEEVALILANLRAGKEPFAPPLSAEDARLDELPIEGE